MLSVKGVKKYFCLFQPGFKLPSISDDGVYTVLSASF